MTQPSQILIAPRVKLNSLPDAERDILRRFFCEHLRGIDAESDRRWRRMVGQWFRAEPGEGFALLRDEERSRPFHARHRVILDRLFQSQERYRLIGPLHDFFKLRAYFVTWGESRVGTPIPKPRSTNFNDCSEDDMREFHSRFVDLLHDPAIQKHLWRHLPAARRVEMVEHVLAESEENRR